MHVARDEVVARPVEHVVVGPAENRHPDVEDLHALFVVDIDVVQLVLAVAKANDLPFGYDEQ